MDVYKTRVDQTTSTKITVANFERDTLQNAPYYQPGSSGGAMSHFAVCPACDNPIQIIGLYKKLEHTPNPYGRHHPRAVADLAKYDQVSYEFCPYSNPDKQPDKSVRRASSQPALPAGAPRTPEPAAASCQHEVPGRTESGHYGSQRTVQIQRKLEGTALTLK